MYLEAPSDQTKKCLAPDLFSFAWEGRHLAEQAKRKRMPEGCRWLEIHDRCEFLQRIENRLLCITIGAGVGKTTAMMQTQFLRGSISDGHLVVAVEFDDLPKNQLGYSWFVSRLCTVVPGLQEDEQTAKALFRRKLRTGELTLIVDGLDQSSANNVDQKSRAKALAGFLNTNVGCCCVVSGRPYSIDRLWRELFDATSEPWVIAQIGPFTNEQCIRFLGEEKIASLANLEADLVANPRMLAKLSRIPQTELQSLFTASDIYWTAFKEKLRDDNVVHLENSSTLDLDSLTFFLSLLAFELLKINAFNGLHSQGRVDELLYEMFHSRQVQVKRFGDSNSHTEFKSKIKAVGHLGSVIQHGIRTSANIERLVFEDRTLLDFLAAIWVTKFSGRNSDADENPDISWLAENHFVDANFNGKEFGQFWRFATEMPGSVRDDEVYIRSMATLFVSKPPAIPDTNNLVYPGWEFENRYRPAEMIYRCWPTMLKLAEMDLAEDVKNLRVRTERLRDVNKKLQIECWEHVNNLLASNSNLDATKFREKLNASFEVESNQALKAVKRFLCEYPAIELGIHKDPWSTLAGQIEKNFVAFPKTVKEDFRFTGREHEVSKTKFLGSPLIRKITKRCDGIRNGLGHAVAMEIQSPFRILKAILPNLHYSVFDHGCLHDEESLVRAANVNWYEAWVAALFFHSRLPSGNEWEYANRNRPGAVEDPFLYCFGNDKGLLEQFSSPAHEPIMQKKPFAGLYDMHGLSGEWTTDLNDADSEVLGDGSGKILRAICGAPDDDVFSNLPESGLPSSWRKYEDPRSGWRQKSLRLVRDV